MTASQTMATEGRRSPAETPEATGPGPSDGGNDIANDVPNPWREAAVVLGRQARRHIRLLAAAGLVCGALAGISKFVLPTTYKASAQILIDPQEFRSFDADAPTTTLEANSAINYVESQMGVIGSERVLLRVIRDQGLVNAAAPQPEGEPQPESADARRARDLAENKALLGLQKTVAITRAERSFLVNITVSDKNPERAADLANAVVKAYGEVNAMDRMASARRLAADLNARVDNLRQQLGESETKLLNFKIEHNLVGLNDKAIAERRISEAADALTAAENREAQARTRLKQLETAPSDIGAVAAFGPDPESRQLQVLIEGRAAARGELEELQSSLGDLHPAVVAGKARLREFDRRISQSLAGLRRSARSQLAEAQAQAQAMNKKLADLAAETTRAREFEAPLHEMESDIEAKRKALTVLQTRWHDADDMSRREAPNFRIISPARAPNTQGKAVGAVTWTVAGGVIGSALALGGLALASMFETAKEAETGETQPPAPKSPAPLPPSSEPPATRRRTLECLAELPAIKGAAGAPDSAAVALLSEAYRRPGSPFSAAVEAIYDRLEAEARKRRDDDEGRPLIVLVAATWPRAGASTLAANLARVAAATGARALLIDAHAAHPAQHRAAPDNAPRTLIEAAGQTRPLLRLTPYSQSLSLIPSLPDEESVCAAIAEESVFQPVAGINGHFDFVVMDGPDASDEEGLRDLVAAADQILLVVSNEPGDEDDAPDLLRRIGAPEQAFAAFVRAAPLDDAREAEAA
ncbi:exopolysaccharide transport family protein [Rhodoblastus sp. 17X3]|uniref:exopolysaccharide transport family protein n=1 Tax=Rhodoblastus sp. 17X3 TaxID=3047026 RepID=UPI0024B6BF4F|nr:exopolysaccharide transport family protein [Rhodoblastus sp. 17X3]MDI9848040.1 exopolysaccharide transport family protein [Rhodoblastus sp. 17X3]